MARPARTRPVQRDRRRRDRAGQHRRGALDDRMISVREATPEDGRALIDFLRMTPLSAGTEFVLDRSPDFSALLRLRGTSRTFLAVSHERLAGTVTALWHDARDGRGRVRVGEVVDLRVAEWARGSRAVARLLGAARDAFAEAGVDWAR